MKIKVTKKEIMENYKNIIYGGYGELLYLFEYTEPKLYTYNLNEGYSNIYEINNNTCVFCGYKQFGNIIPNYDIIKKYQKKSKSIVYKGKINFEQAKKELAELLEQFILEVLQ